MVIGTACLYLLGLLMVILQNTLIPYWFSGSFSYFLPQLAETFALTVLICDTRDVRSPLLAMFTALLCILGFGASPVITIVTYAVFVLVTMLLRHLIFGRATEKQHGPGFVRGVLLIAALVLLSSLIKAVCLTQMNRLLSFDMQNIAAAAASTVSSVIFAALAFHPVAGLCRLGSTNQ